MKTKVFNRQGRIFPDCLLQFGAGKARISILANIVATANKLVHVIYAVLRDQREYHDPEVDYEEMMVQRNATRWFRQMLHYRHLYYTDEGNLITDLKTS